MLFFQSRHIAGHGFGHASDHAGHIPRRSMHHGGGRHEQEGWLTRTKHKKHQSHHHEKRVPPWGNATELLLILWEALYLVDYSKGYESD